MAKFDSILGTVGHTPVVRINKLAPKGVKLVTGDALDFSLEALKIEDDYVTFNLNGLIYTTTLATGNVASARSLASFTGAAA